MAEWLSTEQFCFEAQLHLTVHNIRTGLVTDQICKNYSSHSKHVIRGRKQTTKCDFLVRINFSDTDRHNGVQLSMQIV